MARLTVKQAAATQRYRDARRDGVGVTDAIAGARWSNALRNSVMATIKESNKRRKAA